MSQHSTLSPSSSHRWRRCIAAPAATADEGDTSSSFAREGTAAHTLGERALVYSDEGRRAEFWLGETIEVPYEENGVKKIDKFVVDQEMADFVQIYVDQVNREPGELLCEEQFDLSEVYGVPDQKGTGDAVKLDYENHRLYVGDLKYGRGVMVFAKDNDQLYSYGAGALRAYDMLDEWETITVAIHQPRLNHYDEHTLTRDELEAWIAETKPKAQAANALIGKSAAEIEAAKVPGEKQCQWCSIKGSCRALASWTHEQVYADFTALSAPCESPREAATLDDALLDKLMARVDVIEATTREWRAELKRRLESGIYAGNDFKLVQGKKGNRKWSDEDEAEQIMKTARIKQDDMYTKKLLTFPAAEKALKKSKPKVWAKLERLLSQADGAPAIAPVTDPRPPLVVATEDQFADETNDVSDLV